MKSAMKMGFWGAALWSAILAAGLLVPGAAAKAATYEVTTRADIARTLAGSPIRRIIEIDVSPDETRRLLLWLDAVSRDHVVLGVQPLEL